MFARRRRLLRKRPQLTTRLQVTGLAGLFFLAATFAPLSPLFAESLPSIEQVFDVWRARQERVQTLEVRWTERNIFYPGAFSNNLDPGVRYPKEEAVVERDAVLYLDGTKWRYDLTGPEWWETAGKSVLTKRTEIVTAETYTRYVFVDEREDELHPFAKISRLEAYYGVPPVWPIFNLYRPLINPMGDFNLKEWSMMDGEYQMDEHRTAWLVRRGDPQAPQKAWIDLDNPEFPPVRRTVEVRRPVVTERDESGNPTQFEYGDWMVRSLVQIWYVPDPIAGTRPARWLAESYPQTSAPEPWVDQRQEVEITDFKVNQPIDPTLFTLEFAPGTKVTDSRKVGDDGSADPVRYIVQADKTQRHITPQESRRGNSYREYLSTQTGQAGLPTRSMTSAAFLWILAALAASIAIGLFLRRR